MDICEYFLLKGDNWGVELLGQMVFTLKVLIDTAKLVGCPKGLTSFYS